MRSLGFVLLSAGAAALCLGAPQQSGSNGNSNGGNPPPPSLSTPTPPPAPTGGRGRARGPSASQIFSGTVMTDDGSPLPATAVIERVCNNRIARETYTDSKGRFSFQLGSNQGGLPDASMEGADGAEPSIAIPHAPSAADTSNLDNGLFGCELRANLVGYHSESIPMAGRAGTQLTLIVRRMIGVEGFTTSGTSTLAPKDARKAFQNGLSLLQKKKPEEAQKELIKATDAYPKYAEAWLQLGIVYDTQNRPGQARDAYQKAVAADANYVNPYERLYMLSLRQEQWQEAADLSAKVLRLNSYEFPTAYYYNAVANLQLKNWDAAEKSAREAVKIMGRNSEPKSHYLLGYVLAQKGDYKNAAESLREFLKVAPNAPEHDNAVKMLGEVESRADAQPPAAPAK